MVIDLDFPVDTVCTNAWSGIAVLLPHTALQSQEDEKQALYSFNLYHTLWIHFLGEVISSKLSPYFLFIVTYGLDKSSFQILKHWGCVSFLEMDLFWTKSDSLLGSFLWPMHVYLNMSNSMPSSLCDLEEGWPREESKLKPPSLVCGELSSKERTSQRIPADTVKRGTFWGLPCSSPIIAYRSCFVLSCCFFFFLKKCKLINRFLKRL